MKTAFVVGSLRKGAYSRQLAKAMIQLAPKPLGCEIVEIEPLSFYNQDLEEKPPQAWTDFRQAIRGYDAVVFFTPEYNRSTTAVLKNAIDIGSRPTAQNVWNGKPAAVVSSSPGAMGGFGAHHHLRQILVGVGMATLPQPEMYVGNVGKMFSPDGSVIEPSTREFFGKFLQAFATWAERHAAKA